ncbi:ankyrin repeat domain-containing protein [Methyloversatilis thermotolerans]|uniref:ankyrin repeat domain-containing protein n=1 Tax=Methyloversatilis thermotolerans TaxID=1346290 RepID=UPI00036B216E|nr:ankyrin repeat domain-containing protein [Methyloversatilis thermotolerans]
MSTSFQRIAADQAAALIKRNRAGDLPGLAIFDSRDAASYARAHVDGAQPLSDAAFSTALQSVPRSVPVIVYCYHGNASQVWAERFSDFRYPEVYSVDGGYPALAGALARADQPAATPPALPADASDALRSFIVEHGFSGADLDQPVAYGLTPLMRAALDAREDIADALLAAGASVACRNSDGNNALWLACVGGSSTIVRALAGAGIDLDNRNDTGATALMYCASSGKHDMLALLLDLGADPLLRTDDDYLAADLASTVECLRLLRHTVS